MKHRLANIAIPEGGGSVGVIMAGAAVLSSAPAEQWRSVMNFHDLHLTPVENEVRRSAAFPR